MLLCFLPEHQSPRENQATAPTLGRAATVAVAQGRRRVRVRAEPSHRALAVEGPCWCAQPPGGHT